MWNQKEGEKVQRDLYDIKIDFSALGIKGRAKVRDLWRQKDLGIFDGSYQTKVPYHGVRFVKVTQDN